MTYKPVGVNESSQFPPRVEAHIEALIASDIASKASTSALTTETGRATAAEAAAQAYAIQRSNHTGSQLSTTISDFVTAVEAVAGRVMVVDNGDGTVTVTTTGGGFVLTDNGDGTATLTLDGSSVVIGAVQAAAIVTEIARATAAEAALQNLTNTTFNTALNGTYARKGATNVFTAEQSATAIRLTEQTDAIALRDSLGTNGRRLSIEPVDPTSTKSAQVQIVPGSAVDQTTQTTAQLLLFGKTGTDYERLLIDARLGEFRVTTSRRNAGAQRPITFYIEDAADPLAPTLTTILKIQTNGRLRLYDILEFGSASDTNLYRSAADTLKTDDSFVVGSTLYLGSAADASLSRTGANIITTPGQFISQSTIRAASGLAQEVRLGNAAGTSTAAINFGSAQDASIYYVATNHLKTSGKFEAVGVIKSGAAVTGSRPSASTAGVGAMYYDTTLSKPIWSDGTVWRDAAGTSV